MAALSLSRFEQIVARTTRANGSRRLATAALSNSEEPGGEDRTENTDRRHHRNRFARWPALFHLARRAGIAHERRRFAFPARIGAAQLRKSRGRYAAFGLFEAFPQRLRNPGRATVKINLPPRRRQLQHRRLSLRRRSDKIDIRA